MNTRTRPKAPNKREIEAAQRALAECRNGNFGNDNWKTLNEFQSKYHYGGLWTHLQLSEEGYNQLYGKLMEQRERREVAQLSHEELVKRFLNNAASYGQGSFCIDPMRGAYANSTQICRDEVLQRLQTATRGMPDTYLPAVGSLPYVGGPGWIGRENGHYAFYLMGPFDEPTKLIEDLVNNRHWELGEIGLFVPATDDDVRVHKEKAWRGGYYRAEPEADLRKDFVLEGATKNYRLKDYGRPIGVGTTPTEEREKLQSSELEWHHEIELFAQRTFNTERRVVITI